MLLRDSFPFLFPQWKGKGARGSGRGRECGGWETDKIGWEGNRRGRDGKERGKGLGGKRVNSRVRE